MQKYDLPEEQYIIEYAKCEHYFDDPSIIQTEYTDDLCDKVIRHGQNGYSINGFAGKHNICLNAMCKWLSQPDKYPDFNSAVKISTSAYIHYLQEEIQHSIEERDWVAVNCLRAILVETNKAVPKALTEGLFNNLRQKTAEEIAEEEKAATQTDLMGAMTGSDQ